MIFFVGVFWGQLWLKINFFHIYWKYLIKASRNAWKVVLAASKFARIVKVICLLIPITMQKAKLKKWILIFFFELKRKIEIHERKDFFISYRRNIFHFWDQTFWGKIPGNYLLVKVEINSLGINSWKYKISLKRLGLWITPFLS